MVRVFSNIEEIKKYYVEQTNTYVFKENEEYIDLVKFNFDLYIESNINAFDINAGDINAGDIDAWNIKAGDIKAGDINVWDIKAGDINAWDINAFDITAHDIRYWAVCFAYKNIKCKSIKGRRKNAKHFVLDRKIEVEE